VTALADGTYDALVVDARIDDETAPPAERVTHLELVITAGPAKGEVAEVAAVGLRGDEIDLLGMPATLTVSAGAPSVRIDR
jgi:hypothetical protein